MILILLDADVEIFLKGEEETAVFGEPEGDSNMDILSESGFCFTLPVLAMVSVFFSITRCYCLCVSITFNLYFLFRSKLCFGA